MHPWMDKFPYTVHVMEHQIYNIYENQKGFFFINNPQIQSLSKLQITKRYARDFLATNGKTTSIQLYIG